MTSRYRIAEWFGHPFKPLSGQRRQALARCALSDDPPPPCPYQRGRPACAKRGGVCSIQSDDGPPVIICPKRFGENNLLTSWLARIAGFKNPYLATEVPFMRSPTTNRAAGRIDLVVSSDSEASAWFGLEVQAVYFSGHGMVEDFKLLVHNDDTVAPAPTAVRRPDWRSSSAKRLMPQLQVKVPTLRRWHTKLAVAVDRPFFEAIGGPSQVPSHDLNEGDIIWLVPEVTSEFVLVEHHWEVLSLEDSSRKLLSAETVKRSEFETMLKTKLQRLT